MRFKTYVLILLGGAFGIAACNPDSAGAQPSQSEPHTLQSTDRPQPRMLAKGESSHLIEIHKMAFQTTSQSIKIGDTVTWINKDIVPHTATANDNSWNSGLLRTGESFTLTINNQTRLDYYCLYHRQMKAKLSLAASQ
jgi:plastocyanin